MLPIVVLSAFSAAPPPVTGHYVESRTAAVFAGACHYNGEYCTEGREALCVWHFDQGSSGGVDLAGVDIALALCADANLADPAAHTTRSIYLASGAPPAAANAALELLRTREPRLFEGARVLETLPLQARFGADESYRVSGGTLFELAGRARADRACCKMPLSVWYTPFATIQGRVVGDNSAFALRDERLGRVFSRPGDNCAFTGTFTLEALAR